MLIKNLSPLLGILCVIISVRLTFPRIEPTTQISVSEAKGYPLNQRGDRLRDWHNKLIFIDSGRKQIEKHNNNYLYRACQFGHGQTNSFAFVLLVPGGGLELDAGARTQRMARAREDIRLLDNPNGDGKKTDCCFEPTFETAADDGLAPPASSKLRLADELDTYLDRVQVRGERCTNVGRSWVVPPCPPALPRNGYMVSTSNERPLLPAYGNNKKGFSSFRHPKQRWLMVGSIKIIRLLRGESYQFPRERFGVVIRLTLSSVVGW